MRPRKSFRKRPDRGGELRCEHGGDGRGVAGHILVANLDHLCTARTRCGHVAPPHPCCPTRVARALELVPSLGLDPEAGVRAVGNAGVVDARLFGRSPASRAASRRRPARRERCARPAPRGRREGALGRGAPARVSARRREPSRRDRRDARRRGSVAVGWQPRRAASAASSGIEALTGATSPRSTKPGSEPIAPARNVVPERGDPRTNTSRSSSRPKRSPSVAPRLGARRLATRRLFAVVSRMPCIAAILAAAGGRRARRPLAWPRWSSVHLEGGH